MKRNDKSNIEEKFPKNPENLKKTVQEKPIRKTSTKKSDTLVYDEENSVWKVPEKLTGFQRPVVMKLEKIGDFIEGLYEGLQPVEYKKTILKNQELFSSSHFSFGTSETEEINLSEENFDVGSCDMVKFLPAFNFGISS